MQPLRHGLLPLFLSSALCAQTCTFGAFGRNCGGTLSGQVVAAPSGAALQLDLAAADAGTVAVLVIGQQSRPSPLPGGLCPLLVQPGNTVFGMVDQSGAATFRFPIQGRLPFAVDFQVVTVSGTRAGRLAESTNGLRVACR